MLADDVLEIIPPIDGDRLQVEKDEGSVSLAGYFSGNYQDHSHPPVAFGMSVRDLDSGEVEAEWWLKETREFEREATVYDDLGVMHENLVQDIDRALNRI